MALFSRIYAYILWAVGRSADPARNVTRRETEMEHCDGLAHPLAAMERRNGDGNRLGWCGLDIVHHPPDG